MKVAKSKVWADAKGNLVEDGHEDSAVLVAMPGQLMPDAQLEQYKGADKFFTDAAFDSDAKHVMPKTIAPAKVEPPPTVKMIEGDGTPQPQNREQSAMPKLKKRGKSKK